MLLDAFPDVVDMNVMVPRGFSSRVCNGPLHAASFHSESDYIPSLARADLKIRPRIDLVDDSGCTPLEIALHNGCLSSVRSLLDYCVRSGCPELINLNASFESSNGALAVAQTRGLRYESVALMLSWLHGPANVDLMDTDGRTILMELAATDFYDANRIQAAIDILHILNHQQHDQDQPQPQAGHLMPQHPVAPDPAAPSPASPDFPLHRQFADVDLQDRHGRIALMIAVANGNLTLVRALSVASTSQSAFTRLLGYDSV